MSLAVGPTDWLKANLDPISKAIDAAGGPNLLVGIVASGGEPHMYIVSNCTRGLKKEMCEALADRLREAAKTSQFERPPEDNMFEGVPV